MILSRKISLKPHRLIALCFLLISTFFPLQSIAETPQISIFDSLYKAPEDLPPFDAEKHSDGCSMFPDYRWKSCCVAHDRSYYYGGTKAQRLKADQELKQCVQEKGFGAIAETMFLGVRTGGHPFSVFPWRWGYGRDYKKAEE
ncbi:hypothetical protein ACQZV8_02725 [Magnetococcales bacterium HHB-1]